MPVTRFLLTMLIPPLCGVVPLLLFPEQLGGRDAGAGEQISFTAIFLFLSLVSCAVPGVIFWAFYEWIWRRKPELTRNAFLYASIGAVLGTMFGVWTSMLIGGDLMINALLLGPISGFVTALVCWRVSRKRIEADGV